MKLRAAYLAPFLAVLQGGVSAVVHALFEPLIHVERELRCVR